MADFRRWFTVLAVLAVMACAASAQVGVIAPGGTASSLLACTAAAAGTPELRPEGFTELLGDIVINCTGGPNLAVGTAIPTTNIVVYVTPTGLPITSRLIGSGSEALLIIDEAGSNITAGAPGYGPQALQVPCTTAQQQNVGGSLCAVQVGSVVGSGGLTYAVPVPGTLNTASSAQNVYQGKVGDFGPNTVTFYNVPVLPPATTGVTRTFRVTNIREPVVGQAPGSQVNVFISTSPNQVLPVTYQNIDVGVVGPSMTATVTPTANNPFQQCIPTTYTQTATLTFTEGFATGFKTRVVPGGAANGIANNGAVTNTLYAAEAANTVFTGTNQNIPGGLYGGFASNSESGFISPAFTSGAYTAGLADYGTRLKAVFTNIPAGLTMYVSVTSSTLNGTPNPVGGTSVLPFAVLVGTNSGEATPDAPFTPITSTITGGDVLGGLKIYPLALNPATNTATAVWEVTNSNPSAQDVLQFGVYITYVATSSSSANLYGTPITTLPLNVPPYLVALSYAPEPGGGAFSASSAGNASATLPLPRFNIIKTQQGPWTTIQLCQTTLLYPYVIGGSGLDTGIAVANTSMDPFGTIGQTGSCKLYGYGVTLGGATPVPSTPVVPGCDQVANPLPGVNCFPIVSAGQVGTLDVVSSPLINLQGYVIAVCNFQYAHGYAAVTDLGLHNIFSSYLALELSHPGILVGSPRTGVGGIETLAH